MTFVLATMHQATMFGTMHQDNDFPLNEMERIQLQAARIVTGTNNYASKHLS